MSVFVDDIQSSAWGDPIATWDFSSGVAAVDFVNLGDYRDLLIWFSGCTSNTGGTDNLAIRVSTDNGATFVSAASSYTVVGSSGTSQITLTGAVASSAAQGGRVEINDLNDADWRTKLDVASGTEGSATTAASRIGTRNVAEVNNALRVFWLAGAQFAAGRILVYARR